MTRSLYHTLEALLPTEESSLSFRDYMALALYHPQYGYYNREMFRLGRDGDFVTASEISPLYAQCFANEYANLLPHLTTNTVLECGAGSGRFALDFLTELQHINALPDYYYIYDESLRLREKQQRLLNDKLAHIKTHIVWLDELPKNFTGIIIANEVLDALPCHTFRVDDEGIKERRIALNKKDKQLTWKIERAEDPELLQAIKNLHELYQFSAPYDSEVNLTLRSFLSDITTKLEQGVILFADYGYGECEYYHPERDKGTLSTIYHREHLNDPLQYPGEQDITAHVNFTKVAEYATTFGCDVLGYTTQAAFLLANGLLHLAERNAKSLSEKDIFQMHQDIKWLTMPTEMGERIKIMALGKGMNGKLTGFQFKDNRREL